MRLAPPQWRLSHRENRGAITSARYRSRLPRVNLTSRGGFTLVELTGVILIILVLAAAVVGLAQYVRTRVAVAQCRAEMAALASALEAYKQDHGYYPVQTNQLVTTATGGGTFFTELQPVLTASRVLYRALSGNATGTGTSPSPGRRAYYTGPLVDGKNISNVTNAFQVLKGGPYYFLDPFGSPYCYVSGNPSVQRNQSSYDLWSWGPDQIGVTANDNITNWGQ